MVQATSIIEFLTHENPKLQYRLPNSNGNSSKKSYFTPMKLQEWKEFSFATLEQIYGRRLIDAAREERSSLPNYPYMSPRADRIVLTEPSTTHILTKWSHGIVQPALDAVPEFFNACTWSPSAGQSPEARNQRSHPLQVDSIDEPVSSTTKAGKKRRRIHPDAGTTLACRTHGDVCPSSFVERLPKEYKTKSNWKSSVALEKYLNKETGTWNYGAIKHNEVMPIRQAFTYCITRGCRYGCILTTHEAFIFRIKPLSTDEDIPLHEIVTEKGLMEYVSIPWEPPQDYKGSLTFNLAVWFIHILAGNGHELNWRYDPLSSQQLANATCMAPQTLITPQSQTRSTRKRTRSSQRRTARKRRRSDVGEPINFSFTESLRSISQLSDHDSVASDQSSDQRASDTESEQSLPSRGDKRESKTPDTGSYRGRAMKRGRPARCRGIN